MKLSKLERYYGNDKATKVIYGAILIFAYLVGQGHKDADSLELVFGTLFAAVAIVVAEVYADILGRTIKQRKKLSKEQRRDIESDSLAIVSVSFWPSAIFLLSYLGVFSVHTAFNISYILLLSVLFAFSYWAGRLSKYTKLASVGIATLVSVVGIAVVIIKYTLGH